MPRSMIKRLLVAPALVAVTAATVATPAQAGGYHGPDNIAHHGASGEAPSNTIEAIDLALDQDADFVEVEVQRTADDELVAFEDTSLTRTTNVEEVFPDRSPWFVGSFTLAELRQLDAGSWFAPEFAGERIPTLREVINEVGYRNGLAVEITNPSFYPGIEEDLLEELSANPYYLYRAIALDNLVVQSSTLASASTFHDLAPSVEVGLIYGRTPTDAELVAASEWADRLDLLAIRATRPVVDRAHELGLDVIVHTVNAEADMNVYIGRGVDGIVTAFPELLDGVLD